MSIESSGSAAEAAVQHESELGQKVSKAPVAMDLFAGCGGMSIGLEKAGFKIIHANEINKDASATYQRNFPDVPLVTGDIRKIDAAVLRRELGYPEVDVIAAGPPCQGFSTAGKRLGNDPRNLLFKEVLRFVEVFRPKVVVIENVLGMVLTAKGKVVKQIVSQLEALGYNAYCRVLVASDYGVPQQRKRVFIIGSLDHIAEEELFPRAEGRKISVSQAISDLAFLGVNESSEKYRWAPRSAYQEQMRSNSKVLFNHKSPNHSSRIQSRFGSVPKGQNGNSFLKGSGTSKRTYIKLDPRAVSMTLTTLPEDFLHYSRKRILTVREMARLQSFPDNFEFLGPRTTGGPRRRLECPQYTQVGNAVPPLMAEAVFRTIASILNGD